ncbi:MAG: hypothetical protein WCG26_11195, partial [Chloroflexales bacterium]
PLVSQVRRWLSVGWLLIAFPPPFVKIETCQVRCYAICIHECLTVRARAGLVDAFGLKPETQHLKPCLGRLIV